MPRQARLDAPGTLHHVILRGIERGQIVTDREDGAMFLARLGEVAMATGTTLYLMGDGHANMQFPLSPGRYCRLSSTATCSPWGGTQRTYESHFRRPRRRSDGPGRFASVTEEP